MIRLAREADIPALIEIEVASGALFREIGMDAVADDPPPSHDEYLAHASAGLALVDVDEDDGPVAYILFEESPDGLFIDQVTVDPRHGRQGIGRGLIETGDSIAASRRLAALFLTTFRDVAWNAPYYASLGFAAVDAADYSPWMRERIRLEADRGLAAWPRVLLRREVRD